MHDKVPSYCNNMLHVRRKVVRKPTPSRIAFIVACVPIGTEAKVLSCWDIVNNIPPIQTLTTPCIGLLDLEIPQPVHLY